MMAYEPLCPADEATAEQRGLAAATAEMVDAFKAREFGRCVAAADRLDREFG